MSRNSDYVVASARSAQHSVPVITMAKHHGGPEVFCSLQGEGRSAGMPAVFVRVARCNLHCRWCDTDYTWNWEGTPWPHDRDGEPGYRKYRKDEQTMDLPPALLAELILRHPCRRVVLTGGEPLLQQSGLAEMLGILHAADDRYTTEVETNGTIAPDPAIDAFVDQYNVSPKLANSGNPGHLRIRPEALAWFAGSAKAWFKFVVSAPGDIAEIRELEARHSLPRQRILLMPEGATPAALDAHRDLVVRLCLDEGYSFSDRLHLRLFGAQRGT